MIYNGKSIGATSRDKGATFERQCVQTFRQNGWPRAQRTHDGRIQAQRGDIAGGPEGFHFECKRHEKLSVPTAFDQVKRDANPLDIPVLIHRPSRHETMATLPFSDFLNLAKRGEM
jgi:hypothetical protein